MSIEELRAAEKKKLREQVLSIIRSSKSKTAQYPCTPFSTYEVMQRLRDVKPTYESWHLLGNVLYNLMKEELINGKMVNMGSRGNIGTWVWWERIQQNDEKLS